MSMMKFLWLIVGLFGFGFGATAAQADPKQELAQAIGSLQNKTNYSWTATTVPHGERTPWVQSPINGKTEKGGRTYFAFSIEGNQVEAAFLGTRSAINTDGVWELATELTGERLALANRLQAFKAPAVEAEELLNQSQNLRRNRDGSFEAELPAPVVKEMLAERSRSGIQEGGPANPKGSVKFWVRNGVLEKFEYTLQGKIIIPDFRQEFDVDRTTTVEIKNVGSTRVTLPPAAMQKLSGPAR